MRHPVDVAVDEGEMRLFHRTVTEQVGPGEPTIHLRVESSAPVAAVVRWTVPPSNAIEAVAMTRVDESSYETLMPELDKGTKIRYWITAAGAGGREVRLPEDPARSFPLIYKGTVSKAVLVAHIVFMFAAFFFMVMSYLGAIRILQGREGKQGTVRAGRWVLACSFIGCWPLGFVLNRQTFGPVWEGFPFGYDITDNKTQLIFVFWLVSLLLVRGSFFGRGEERDTLGPRAFAWAIIASFIASLVLFIVPHSI